MTSTFFLLLSWQNQYEYCDFGNRDFSVAATGIDSVAATGIDSVAATGIDSVAATGIDSVAATGINSVAATGIDSVAATQEDQVYENSAAMPDPKVRVSNETEYHLLQHLFRS